MSNVDLNDLDSYIDYLNETGESLSVEDKCQEYLDFLLNVYPDSKEEVLEKLKEMISDKSTKND